MTDINENRKRRRGPEPLADPRRHCVNVRFNDEEVKLLDSKRKGLARAEWLRCASIDKLPVVIPEINQKAYAELAKVGSNLNQVAKQLNIDTTSKSWEEIVALLKSVRGALIGVKL
ncbi:MAG: plasmid mobilization protein [Halobacteriota archaeon]